MDLSKPIPIEKVCHHCNKVINVYGYVDQNCSECGEEIIPVKDKLYTVDYVAPEGLNVLSLSDRRTDRELLELKGITVKNYFTTGVDPKTQNDNINLGKNISINKYIFPNHKINVLYIGGEDLEDLKRLRKELKPNQIIIK